MLTNLFDNHSNLCTFETKNLRGVGLSDLLGISGPEVQNII